MSRGPMNWAKAKTRPHGRPSMKDATVTKYATIFCSACRITVMCPIDRDGNLAGSPSHWLDAEPDYFCSPTCKEKGPAEPVRDRVEAHVDFERGTAPNPDRRRGRLDALLGYDCIGTLPAYVKGHGEGMAVRKTIEAAITEMQKDRDPPSGS